MAVAIAAALCVPVIFSALAWACTPQASIAIAINEGLPRQATTVTGTAFPSGPVAIMWGGASGTRLATVQGPSFAASITIPDSAPGPQFIVALAEDDTGHRWQAAAPFEVLDPAAGSTPVDQPATDTDTTTSAAAAPGSPSAAPVAAAAPSTAKMPAPAASAKRSIGARRERPVSTPQRASAPPTSRAAAQAKLPAPVFAGSTAPQTSRAASGAPPARAKHPTDVAPSQGSLALGDVSRGFSSPSQGGLVPSVSGAAAHASPSRTPLTVGLILLSTGLMALLGSGTLAGTRRRRSRAGIDEH